MWDSMAAWVGQIAPSKLHQHHALQLNASADGWFAYRLHGQPDFQAHPAFLINANVRHQIQGDVQQGIILYMEPHSSIGRALRQTCLPDGLPACALPALPIPPTAILLEQLNSLEEMRVFTQQVIQTLIPVLPPLAPLDGRIQDLLIYIQTHLADDLTLPVLAGRTHLSPSRLMHLFREQVGVPIRRYILWRRLIRAHAEIGRGYALTEAAHQAGFADAAHMNRAFRLMVGHPPSAIFSRFVQAYMDIP